MVVGNLERDVADWEAAKRKCDIRNEELRMNFSVFYLSFRELSHVRYFFIKTVNLSFRELFKCFHRGSFLLPLFFSQEIFISFAFIVAQFVVASHEICAAWDPKGKVLT